MKQFITILFATFVAALYAPLVATAQDLPTPIEERVSHLEKRVAWLDYKVRNFAGEGMVVFLFGVFCALWAQNTRRNAWLWFFLGLLFSVITVIVVLIKNSKYRRE